MAAGVPLVTVAAGALADLVEDDRGFSAPACTPHDIAQALGAALADPHEADRRAARARAYVTEERGFAAEAEATLALYERAVAARRAPRA